MVERFNRTLAMMLTIAMEEAQDDDWETIRTLRNDVWAPSVTPSGCSLQHELGERNDHQQIRRRVGNPLLKRVRGCLKTQCGATDAAKKTGNPNYETHEADWLYCSVSKSKQNRKFTTPWTGPFEIIEQVSEKPKTNPAGACQSLKAISAAYDKNKTKMRNKFDVNGNPSLSPGYIAHDWGELKKTMDGMVRQHQQW
ncbi:hypothetical protein T07_11504 [Trichinella nelsoni]|uniref:Uncharacterized protein n=1 Tax=Trichinella nelsoni TaxID=6336 RepID=A0A0V0RZR1_9BILA|nr:hypothetical protein T07_11504 [Trichinella nelsoni]